MKCSALEEKVELKDPIKEKIKEHPCFCEKAHRKYSRMHLAVAPKCNIQCNYCNRKFDCLNESRPGVTSKVLKPEEAFEYFKLVKSKLQDLTVVGIAGPGDPLANPDETFKTLELIKSEAKGVKFCLSTNGLMLEHYIDEIVSLGIEHITITINGVDENVISKIYKYVKYNGKVYRGIDAANILIERQIAGLKAASDKGLVVKVNTVLIPGINDAYIGDISRMVRGYGAFIHNIIPLINPEDKCTLFSRNGIREPNEQELGFARLAAAMEMGGMSRVMKHCKQCRADVVGKLGEDLKF